MAISKNYKKEIEFQAKKDEAQSNFEAQIRELESKKSDLVRVAAQAELSGDDVNYEAAADGILFIQSTLQMLKQQKLNMDLVSITGDVTITMNSVFDAMNTMAQGGVKLPNYKKIMRTQKKLGEYMRETATSQKMLQGMTKRANPATRRTRSPEESDAVKAMISAERARMAGTTVSGKSDSLAEQIAKERNAPIV